MPLPTIVFDPALDPNEPIEHRLIWATDIIGTRDQKEQRRSLRRLPRQTIQFTVDTVDASEMARLDALLQAGSPDGFKVPMWCDRYTLPATLSSGATSLALPDAGYEFVVGDQMMLYNNPRSYELVTLTPVSATSLVAHWPFDNDPLDISGNARHGTFQTGLRQNSILWSRDLTNAAWTKGGTGTVALDAVGIDGLPNTATTLTDTSAALYYTASQSKTIANDSATHTVAIWIKKDADQTRFPQVKFTFTGGTTVNKSVAINTATGQIRVTTGATMFDGANYGYPAWWILQIWAANNTTGNTTASVQIYAAAAATWDVDSVTGVGSVVIGNVQLELNASAFNPPAIITTTAAVGVTDPPVYVPGKVGAAAAGLDGLNDYIQVADTAALKYTGQDFTMAAWINPDIGEADGGYIFSKPWNASGQYNWQLNYGPTGIVTLLLLGDSSYNVAPTQTIPPGSGWHHVAVTITSATKLVLHYFDGVQVNSSNHAITGWVPTLGDANQALCIGTLYPYGPSWSGITNQAFDGAIDDARLYSRVLTPTEIASLAATKGTFTATANTWPAGTLAVPLKPGYLLGPVSPSRSFRDGQNVTLAFALR